MKHLAKFSALLLSVFIALPVASQTRSLPDFVPLVEKNAKAVVNISTTRKESKLQSKFHGYNLPDFPKDHPMYDFFSKFFEGVPESTPNRQRVSLGSGFIMSADGYIISNYHVVHDADEIIVRLNDRREFAADVVGDDKRSDLAVLKIDADDLPVLELGDSAKLKVGEWLLAIGSPFGLDYSVTQGIVSAIGRNLPNESYVPFIQTDVAINPGNSGGPLFNLQGEVIGVNSQIYSRTGGFMGMSFAIPVNVVKDVYRQLKDNGRVLRGWLGVLIQDVTQELAESFAMKKPHGALISEILRDSPASKARFEVGDIIVSFDGDKIETSSDLPPLVGISKVGDTVPVGVIRDGKMVSVKVKIGELPQDDEQENAFGYNRREHTDNPLNVSVEDLTESKRKKLQIEDKTHGVVVSHIVPGPAFDAGLRQGDAILRLNRVKIKDTEHFRKLVTKLPKNQSVPVLIQRRGGPVFLALKLAKNDDHDH